MKASAKQPKTFFKSSDHSVLHSAMEAIEQIDRDTRKQKLAQLVPLNAAKETIQQRIAELEHQLAQIDKAIATIAGSPSTPTRPAERRNWDETRDRVEQLMVKRKGQKYAAADLVREFPDLDGISVSTLLRPLVEKGKIHTDNSFGAKRTRYFIAA